MIKKFDLWMYRVDDLLIRNTGLDSGSFEDWDWESDYESGMLPIDAVLEFLAENNLLGPIACCAGEGPETDEASTG